MNDEMVIVKPAFLLRIMVLFISIVGTNVIYADLKSHEFLMSYILCYDRIKLLFGFICSWSFVVFSNITRTEISKAGISNELRIFKFTLYKGFFRKWEDMEIRYYPLYIFPAVAVDKNASPIFFKLLHNNFRPALQMIGKYGIDRVVKESDKKYFA